MTCGSGAGSRDADGAPEPPEALLQVPAGALWAVQAASSGMPAIPAAPTPTALSNERRSEGSELILVAIDSLWFMDNPPPGSAWGAELTPSPMMDPCPFLRQGRCARVWVLGRRDLGAAPPQPPTNPTNPANLAASFWLPY